MASRVEISSTDPPHLGLLGGFRLRVAARIVELPMNAQRLIAFLALHDPPLLRPFVAGSLWGDVTQRLAGGSLRSALWRLPGPPEQLVALTSDHISLAPSVRVDVRESEALAHRVLDPSAPLEEIEQVSEDVLSGDVLPDWTEDWVLLKGEQHHQLRLRALEALCRRLTAVGRVGQAVQAGIAAVSGEPLRESASRVLVEAHLAEHNTAAALRVYEQYAQLLMDEMGLEPSQPLRDLVRQG